MAPRTTLNGHVLTDAQVLVLGIAFGAAERLMTKSDPNALAREDPQLLAELKHTLAELRAIARGQDPDAAAWPPKQES